MTPKKRTVSLAAALARLPVGPMPAQGYSIGARRLYEYLRTTPSLQISHLAFKAAWKRSPGMDCSVAGYASMLTEVEHFVEVCQSAVYANSMRKPAEQGFRWK